MPRITLRVNKQPIPESRGEPAEHLAWQLQRAGFQDFSVQLHDFTHVPSQRLDRMMAMLGAPLRRIPRYRDNLVAIAKTDGVPGSGRDV